MKVLNKSLKVVLLGSTLMTSVKVAADLTYTVDTYTSLMDTLAVGLDMPETDKAAEITGVPYGLDKGYLGTIAATNESYVWTDSATNPTSIKVLAIVGGQWCTFANTSVTSISGTTQLDLLQTMSDGSPATTNKMTINLTKAISAAATIPPVTLLAFLKANLTTANKAYTLGALKSLSAPVSGWVATALFQAAAGTNAASDAVAATLDPIAFTLTAPVTLAAYSAVFNYTAKLVDLSSYNVAATSGSVADGTDVVKLTNGANTLTFKLKPEKIASHLTGIKEGVVDGANALTRRRLKAVSPFTYQTIATAADSINAMLATDPSAVTTDTLKETIGVLLGKIGGGATNVGTGIQGILDSTGQSTLRGILNMMAEGYIKSSNFTSSACSPLVTNYGGVVLGQNLVLDNTSWSNKGSKILVTSGSGNTMKTYSCDVSGLSSMKVSSTINAVLLFTSEEGDVFWVKSFDVTGIDKSTDTPASFKDDHLAMAIAEKFYSVGTTTITGQTLTQLKAAS